MNCELPPQIPENQEIPGFSGQKLCGGIRLNCELPPQISKNQEIPGFSGQKLCGGNELTCELPPQFFRKPCFSGNQVNFSNRSTFPETKQLPPQTFPVAHSQAFCLGLKWQVGFGKILRGKTVAERCSRKTVIYDSGGFELWVK